MLETYGFRAVLATGIASAFPGGRPTDLRINVSRHFGSTSVRPGAPAQLCCLEASAEPTQAVSHVPVSSIDLPGNKL